METLLDSSYNHFSIVKQFITKFSLLCWILRSCICSMCTQVPDKPLWLVFCKLFCFMFLEYSFLLYRKHFSYETLFRKLRFVLNEKIFLSQIFVFFFRSHVYFRQKVCYLFYESFVWFLRVFLVRTVFSRYPKGIFYSLIYVVSSVWKRPKDMIL